MDKGAPGMRARREALRAQRKLARDYAAGREDARGHLADLEVAQLELFDREGR